MDDLDFSNFTRRTMYCAAPSVFIISAVVGLIVSGLLPHEKAGPEATPVPTPTAITKNASDFEDARREAVFARPVPVAKADCAAAIVSDGTAPLEIRSYQSEKQSKLKVRW